MITLDELSALTGATLQGEGSTLIKHIAHPDDASEGDLCFVLDKKLLPLLESCKASAVILNPEHESYFPGNKLLHADPYYVYAKASTFFPLIKEALPGVHASAVIDESVQLGKDVSIAAHVVIEKNVSLGDGCIVGAGCYIGEECSLGARTKLHANVTLFSHTLTGSDCRLHAGVVIGDEGFGFAPHGGEWHRIEQIGHVELGDRVEIGSNTTIDRGAMTATIIENGVKIDNLVQIGHNVRIGSHSVIAACTAIAGSTVIGKSCVIAGAVGMAGHLTIADRITILGMSRVTGSLTKVGSTYASGTNIDDVRSWRRNSVRFSQLDTMAKRLIKLEKELAQLQQSSSSE